MLRFVNESTQVEMFIVYVGLRVEATFRRLYESHRPLSRASERK